MTRTILLLLCTCFLSTTWAMPEHSPRPGGVAIVDVGTAKLAMPEVNLDSKPVLVMQDADRWKAVVGISLDTEPGSADDFCQRN